MRGRARCHPQAPTAGAAGGEGGKGHCKAPLRLLRGELLVCTTTTATPAASAPARGKSTVPAEAGCFLGTVSWAHCFPRCPHRIQGWGTSGLLMCRVGTHACTPLAEQPATAPATPLLSADPSPLIFQRAILAMTLSERHWGCSCRLWAGQGASPTQGLRSAQPILGKAGCGPQAAGLFHCHTAQQHRKGSGQAQFRSHLTPNIPEQSRTW